MWLRAIQPVYFSFITCMHINYFKILLHCLLLLLNSLLSQNFMHENKTIKHNTKPNGKKNILKLPFHI